MHRPGEQRPDVGVALFITAHQVDADGSEHAPRGGVPEGVAAVLTRIEQRGGQDVQVGQILDLIEEWPTDRPLVERRKDDWLAVPVLGDVVALHVVNYQAVRQIPPSFPLLDGVDGAVQKDALAGAGGAQNQ